MRPGDIVEVLFLDHVSHGQKPMPFYVYGRLISMTRTAIVVACWAHKDKKAKCDHNTHVYTIVRSAIKEIHRLKREPVNE